MSTVRKTTFSVLLILSQWAMATNSAWTSGQIQQKSLRSQFTALWFNPEQPGHGISLYMLDQNRMVVTWYVFDQNSQPIWLLGQGTVSHETAVLDVTQSSGGAFPPDFDPDAIEHNPWGQFELEFLDCNSMNFSWQAIDAGQFPAGSMSLKRLNQTLGVEAQCETTQRPEVPNDLQQWLLGDAGDQFANLDQPAVLLMGGGADVDQAFSQRVLPHMGSNKDVVVLRASGEDGYNSYLKDLLDANSVETLLVDSRDKANSDYVEWVVQTAEFVWIAGGDQSQYLELWQDSKLQSAVQSVYDKGGVIGGTSAGMALLAGSIYDPGDEPGAVSSEVVEDFCHSSLKFHSSFVDIPLLQKSLTDTHFQNRDRMGRAIVSMGHHAADFFVIAIDEATSLFIEPSSKAWVDGSGSAYILYEGSNTQRTTLQCQQPVIYKNIIRVKLNTGKFFDFSCSCHTGEEMEVSIDGNESEFYSPINPYQ